MMAYYFAQNSVNAAYKEDSYVDYSIQMVPSIIYSFVVIPLNLVYKIAAIKLTNWGLHLYFLHLIVTFFMIFLHQIENHRTESSYESNLTTKLFVVNI